MNQVVHFGAGALGRGLVVPMLYESGMDVVLVDTNPRLIDFLRKNCVYQIDETDTAQRMKTIEVKDVIHSIDEKEKLTKVLKETKLVTTSVRRENLIHVARVLADAWADTDNSNRRVYCCENVEGVGSYFKELLLENAGNNQAEVNLGAVTVPDTIVDRICAANPEDLTITTEEFHECCVDRETVEETGVEKIPAIGQITAHFYRKRYLLNSFADATAYLGVAKGHQYLYQAFIDEEIQKEVDPFIQLVIGHLDVKYHIAREELNNWYALYKKRLANPEIRRSLDTVARGGWSKLFLEERFVAPLLEMMELGVDIQDGICLIHQIVKVIQKEEALTDEMVLDTLKKLWSVNGQGTRFLMEYQQFILR